MENIQNQEQYKSIKPKVNLFILAFQSFFIGLSFFGALGGIGGSVLFVFFGEKGLWILPILYLPLFFTILLLRKISYEEVEYRFYKDRIEYVDGFLVKNKKMIKYENIIDISQTRGVLFDRLFNLGTIQISTAGTSIITGLYMYYIENPDYVYDWIVKVTSKNNNF